MNLLKYGYKKTANHNVKCRFFMSFYKLNQGMDRLNFQISALVAWAKSSGDYREDSPFPPIMLPILYIS
ncbi:hypothetical protein BACEGG_02622 [Bacteroides eggerthii DSM 20697]|nr:hypothetical protein BACEGG_02622 [Bacteroides eggerthii DSM 20697]